MTIFLNKKATKGHSIIKTNKIQFVYFSLCVYIWVVGIKDEINKIRVDIFENIFLKKMHYLKKIGMQISKNN